MRRRKDISSKRISIAKYRELYYFCMQYGEKKKEGREDDCKLIEETAESVDKAIAPYIIKNATEGVPYEYMEVPCGRKQFYQKREEFFFELSKKR